MAYDPTLPANNSPIVSAELRAQLAGLKDLIDAVPTSSAITDVLNANTAGPITAIPPVDLAVSDPPQASEVQAIADMVTAMYQALTRT